MKGRRLKITALLALIFVTIAIYGGCVGKDNGTEGSASTKKTDAIGKTEEKTGTETSGLQPYTMPISKEGIKLTMFTAFPAGHAAFFATLNDSPNMKAYEELTGVKVDITAAPGDSYSERKNLLFASGDMPDIIWSETAQDDAFMYGVNDDLIIPIDDLIKKHGYYFNEWANYFPDVKNHSICADGKMYYMPSIDITLATSIGCGYFIREEWLEKFNLEVPKTLDDIYSVLTVFKKEDPAGEGKTIPFSAPVPFQIVNSILGSFGTTNGVYQIDGVVKYGPMEPEFKEGLKYLNKLYKEELISSDYLAHDLKIYSANVPDNIGLIWGWRGSGCRTPLMSSGYSEQEAENIFRPISGMKGKDGKYHWFMTQAGKVTLGSGEFITSTNKYQVETLKWLDYKNSQEGAWTVGAGEKGVSWDINASDAPYITDFILKNPDGLEENDAFHKYGGITWEYISHAAIPYDYVTAKWPYRHKDLVELRKTVTTETLFSQYQENWLDFDASRQLHPNVRYKADEKEELAIILQDLETLVDENLHKFIMGLEPMEKWDEVINQMKKMKVDRLLSINQAALDSVK